MGGVESVWEGVRGINDENENFNNEKVFILRFFLGSNTGHPIKV
jgi:hypothetical protein